MKYKNTTDQELALPGVGLIAPKAEFESDEVIENPNIEIKKVQKSTEVVKGVEPEMPEAPAPDEKKGE